MHTPSPTKKHAAGGREEHVTPSKPAGADSGNRPRASPTFGPTQMKAMGVHNVSSPLPDCYKQLCDFLTTPSKLLPQSTQKLVEEKLPLDEQSRQALAYLPPSRFIYVAGDWPPPQPLGQAWARHYERMLAEPFEMTRLLNRDREDRRPPTEETWRSLVYSHSEVLFHDDEEIALEFNSGVRAQPAPGETYTMAPDVSMGIHWKAISNSHRACGTGRLAFAFADAEEKRTPTNQDESKLLCVMAHRIQHLVSALDLSSTSKPVVAPSGLPLPVAVGLVRGASTWSVLFMWRHSKKALRWRRLFENQNLDTPTGFLDYVTFMFRLYCYGHLFARAVRYLLTGKEERSKGEGGDNKDDEDDKDDEDEDEDDDDDDEDDEDESKGDEGHTGGELRLKTSGERQQLDLSDLGGEMTVLKNLGRWGNDVEVGTRSDGVTVVRKTYRQWKATAHELKSYMLLRDHGVEGVAPKLLGHWRNDSTGEWTMELEYVLATPHYQLHGLHNLKLYMSGLLQALALLHQKVGLVHRDIKPTNILANFTHTGGMHVRLVDFEFAYRLGDIITDDRCGTDGYVSPEWRKATPRVADPRTNQELKAALQSGAGDVYAAGAILLELLLNVDLNGYQNESEELTAYLDELMAQPLSHEERCHLLIHSLPDLGPDRSLRRTKPLVYADTGAALDLAHKLTTHSVPARITATEALEHPFLIGASKATMIRGRQESQ